jgi:hypothetical protein
MHSDHHSIRTMYTYRTILASSNSSFSVHLLPTHILQRPAENIAGFHNTTRFTVVERMLKLARLSMNLVKSLEVRLLQVEDLGERDRGFSNQSGITAGSDQVEHACLLTSRFAFIRSGLADFGTTLQFPLWTPQLSSTAAGDLEYFSLSCVTKGSLMTAEGLPAVGRPRAASRGVQESEDPR